MVLFDLFLAILSSVKQVFLNKILIMQNELFQFLTKASKSDRLLFNFIAGFILFGVAVIVLMLVTQPAKSEADARIMRILGVVAFAFTLFAFGCIYYGKKKSEQLLDAFKKHPEKVLWAYKIRSQRRGIIFYGVHFKTNEDKLHGALLNNEAEADKLLELVAVSYPHILVGSSSENKAKFKAMLK